jgi:hypothetical protein
MKPMLRARSAAWIILAVLVIGCGNGSKCPPGKAPPPVAVYSCSPVPANTPNTCADSNDPSFHFPIGCVVHLPTENNNYPCTGRLACTCEKNPFPNNPEGGPVWTCPI